MTMMDPRLGTPESDAEAARLREQAAERQRARDRFVRTELEDEPSGEEVHRAQVKAKLLEMRRELSELATKVDRLDQKSARWEKQRGHLLDQFDKLSLRVEKVEEWGEVDDLAVRVKALEERVVERARDTGEAARLGAELTRRLDAIARTVDGHTKALENARGSDEYVPVEALRTDLESLQTAVQELTKVLVAQAKPDPVQVWEGMKAEARRKAEAVKRDADDDELLTASAADRLPNRSIIIMDGARDAVPVRRVGDDWYEVAAGARAPLFGSSLYRLLWAPEEDED